MPSVLFVCVANSFRSQMAEGFAKALGNRRWDIWSAGSNPSGRIHPLAIQLMAEAGIDLTMHRSKGLGEVPARRWDCVVTMGCGDACPSVNATHRVDWAIPDPAGLPLEEARRIRDQLAVLVRELIGQADRRGLDKSAGTDKDTCPSSSR
ncbi:MAG: arsenate reductase ArsC [Candidatus Omnitrophica bacterium]|nr:arsenate reductase ArsC [Candidatus Omnitrophota bacterium]